jgi:hypothetical protein
MKANTKKRLILGIVFTVLYCLTVILYYYIRFSYTSRMVFIFTGIITIALITTFIVNFKKEGKVFKNIILPIIIVVVLSASIIKLFDVITDRNTIRALLGINPSGEDFVLNTNNKYFVITNEEKLTYMSDGGSNYNSYYEIDLDNKTIVYLEDHYMGGKGYDYIGRVLAKKEISDEVAEKLKSLFNTVFSNTTSGLLDIENNNKPAGQEKYSIIQLLNYYRFSNQEYSEIKVYNEDIINEFNNLVK